jgi:hypothetical protein
MKSAKWPCPNSNFRDTFIFKKIMPTLMMRSRGIILSIACVCVLLITLAYGNCTSTAETSQSVERYGVDTPRQLPRLEVNVTLNETMVQSGLTIMVDVVVTAQGTPVEGAYVEFWLSQEGGLFTPANTTTDAQGKARSILKTPISQVTLVCTVSVNAAKEGYDSAMNTAEFTLLPLPKIELSASSNLTQMYNNQSAEITVYVTYQGTPVKNATVRVGLGMGLKQTGEEYFQPNNGTTDADGKFVCVFTPPVVVNATEFGISISGYADGFSENTTYIVIKVLPEVPHDNNQNTQKTPDYGIYWLILILVLVSVANLIRKSVSGHQKER